MTKEEFRALKSLEDRRVHMTFIDGQRVIATLVSVQTDMDESQHLIYDRLEWASTQYDRVEEFYLRVLRDDEEPLFVSDEATLFDHLVFEQRIDCK